jgi:hypothetical protein
MIALVAALLLAGAPAQGGFSETLAKGWSVSLPPPIDEQVRPYKACLLGQFDRNPRLRTVDAAGFSEANAEAIAACAEARRAAAAAADAALRSKRAYRNEAKRRSSIEKFLADLDSGLLPIYLATVPAPVVQLPATVDVQVPALTDEQAAIVYDQCLARSAARASHTDAADSAIFAIARAQCAETRSGLLRASGSERARIFDSIDADKEAGFPEATRKVRERRRAFEAQTGPAK